VGCRGRTIIVQSVHDNRTIISLNKIKYSKITIILFSLSFYFRPPWSGRSRLSHAAPRPDWPRRKVRPSGPCAYHVTRLCRAFEIGKTRRRFKSLPVAFERLKAPSSRNPTIAMGPGTPGQYFLSKSRQASSARRLSGSTIQTGTRKNVTLSHFFLCCRCACLVRPSLGLADEILVGRS
jgi:hypothetical protein